MRKLAGNLKNNWKKITKFSFVFGSAGIDQNGWKFGAMTCRSNCWWRDAVRLSWCLSLRAERLFYSLPFFFFGRNGIHFFLPRRIHKKIFWHGKVSKEEAVHLQHAPIVTAQRGKTHEAAGDCFVSNGSARARASARAVDWKSKIKNQFKNPKKIKIKRRRKGEFWCAGCIRNHGRRSNFLGK